MGASANYQVTPGVLGEAQDWRLEHGDGFVGLQGLPDGSVDMVLTDVPYGEVNDTEQGGFRRLDKGGADVLTFDLLAFADETVRVAQSAIYIFCGYEQISPLVTRFRKTHGLTVRLRPLVDPKRDLEAPVMAPLVSGIPGPTLAHPSHHGATGAGWPRVGEVFEEPEARMPAVELPAVELVDGGRTEVRCWEKTNPSPMCEQEIYVSEFEYCVYARKPGAYHDAAVAGRGSWVYPSGSSKRHPTEKPLPLFQRIVRTSCPPGGIVCDPCSGSGTTGHAAVSTGRRFVGWELNQKWHGAAWIRVKDAADQLSIFG